MSASFDPSKWSQIFPTKGYRRSKRNYVDYVRWQRKGLIDVLRRYREEYPKQISAFKDSAYNALDTQSPKMWGEMYANLDKRGLSDSASFLGGAKQQHTSWLTGQKQEIESSAQGMEMAAQQAILAALGKPDYAGVYTQWTDMEKQLAEYLNYLDTKSKQK